MICQALWEMIRDNTKFTEDMLRKRLREIGLGEVNVRVSRAKRARECTECGRPPKSNTVKCGYCGTITEPDCIFDIV